MGKSKHLLETLPAIVWLVIMCCPLVTVAQPETQLPDQQTPYVTTIGEQFKGLQLPPWLADRKIVVDPRTRPMLQFRLWADRGKPFFPYFLISLLATAVSWKVMEPVLLKARSQCREHFWKSFWLASLVVAVTVLLARALLASQVGQPLADLLLGVMQLGLVTGLAVSASFVGQSLLSRLGLSGLPCLASRPRLAKFLELTAGNLVICLLLLLPGVGRLPRIGPRLFLLFCILGFGGLLRAIKR